MMTELENPFSFNGFGRNYAFFVERNIYLQIFMDGTSTVTFKIAVDFLITENWKFLGILKKCWLRDNQFYGGHEKENEKFRDPCHISAWKNGTAYPHCTLKVK